MVPGGRGEAVPTVPIRQNLKTPGNDQLQPVVLVWARVRAVARERRPGEKPLIRRLP